MPWRQGRFQRGDWTFFRKQGARPVEERGEDAEDHEEVDLVVLANLRQEELKYLAMRGRVSGGGRASAIDNTYIYIQTRATMEASVFVRNGF